MKTNLLPPSLLAADEKGAHKPVGTLRDVDVPGNYTKDGQREGCDAQIMHCVPGNLSRNREPLLDLLEASSHPGSGPGRQAGEVRRLGQRGRKPGGLAGCPLGRKPGWKLLQKLQLVLLALAVHEGGAPAPPQLGAGLCGGPGRGCPFQGRAG
jgi:hypothetical protein